MKTQEELSKIKEEVETMNKKLQELTEEELKGHGHLFIATIENPYTFGILYIY